ncbi:MAG: hypothetical protein IKF91_04565 [Bacilli bacterium]|nr:hypothetical protein [Bacilli bacterium]
MRVGKYILIGIFVFFVIINTILLFTFNRFSNSVLFDKTIIGLKEDLLNYKKGSLIILKKGDIKIGDDILFYDTKNSKNFVNSERVMKMLNKDTFVIRDNEYVSKDYVIGKVDDIFVIPFIGYLYNIFTSKIGYLLFVIFPITFYFITLLRNYKKA